MESATGVRDDGPTQFYLGHTRRTSALVARSETVGKLVLDKTSLDMLDHFLTANSEFGYQLHVSVTLEVMHASGLTLDVMILLDRERNLLSTGCAVSIVDPCL